MPATTPPPPRLSWAEAAWERVVPLPVVDDAFVRTRLAEWPDLATRPWTPLAGGLRGAHVRLGDDLVARFATSPGEDLRREARLLAHVAPRVRVPCVERASRDVLVTRYVPHEELPATEAAARAVGRAAARIHADTYPTWGFLDAELAVSTPTPTATEALTPHLEACLAGRAGRLLGADAPRVSAAWAGARTRFLDAETPPGLLHADFKPANVKWLPAERDVVVFDWEFAWAGPALFDLGQLLRWCVPPPFEAALAASYAAHGGRLPEGWRRTAELLDLVNLVALVGDGAPRPIRERDLLGRIRATLASGAG